MRWRLVVVFNIIPQVIAGVEVAAEKAVTMATEELAEDARRRVPVDTGELRSSIGTSFDGRKDGFVYAGAAHAPFIEFGTRFMPPQPFLYPALDRARDLFLKAENFFPKGSL